MKKHSINPKAITQIMKGAAYADTINSNAIIKGDRVVSS